MDDTLNRFDPGTARLTMWAARRMEWSDVVVAKNETTFATAMNDRARHAASGSARRVWSSRSRS